MGNGSELKTTIDNMYISVMVIQQHDHSPVLRISPTFPGISSGGIYIYKTIRGIQTGLHVLLSDYCGTMCSPSCARQLHLTVLGVIR